MSTVEDALPRDAESMIKVLKSMGVQRYEPRVLHQLLEFMHRYCIEVFSDGADYAAHAGRVGQIESEDVHLAMKLKAAASETTQPAFLELLARERNNQPLPHAPKQSNQLPSQRLCLLTPNFQLEPPQPSQVEPPAEPDVAVVTEQLDKTGGGSSQPPLKRMRSSGKPIEIRMPTKLKGDAGEDGQPSDVLSSQGALCFSEDMHASLVDRSELEEVLLDSDDALQDALKAELEAEDDAYWE
mmetsp:Transcript_12129/g.20476  ORF Transcript_12129/g.20476 Transcript_12129/m.20476 type:complete len:241 (+) Transcript_12129:193-915(+)